MATLSAQDAAHLLRRSGFGGGWGAAPNDLTRLTGMDRAAAVELVLDQTNVSPDTAPAEYSDPSKGDWERVWALTLWWLERMRTAKVTGRTSGAKAPSPLAEKMAMFWHNHFVSGEDKVGNAVHMYDQHHAFRVYGLGSFQDLALAVTTQAHACEAMLRYLDNDPNVKGDPNENLARELMELFTMGVNNYTQDDVVAGARAWTGYNIDDSDSGGHVFRYYPENHDTGSKTLLGQTANWDGPGMVRLLCTGTAVNPAAKIAGESPSVTTSKYVARRIWSYFAYPNPADALVESLAANWRANGLNVTALLRDIFNRDEFYTPTAKLGLVKSPVEFVVATLRSTGLRTDQAVPWGLGDMGQQPFYPPNVAGWKQNSYWLSTSAVWSRADYVSNIMWPAANLAPAFLGSVRPKLDANGNIVFDGQRNVVYNQTVAQAVQVAFDACGITEPSATTRADLEAWVTQQRAVTGPPKWVWFWKLSINLGVLVLLSPDFALA